MHQLKAIFFDAAGTLIYLRRSVGENYRDVAAGFGIDLDSDRLNQAFVAAWASSPTRPALHKPRLDDDKGWWRDLVNRVLVQVLSPAQRRSLDPAIYFETVYAHFTKPDVWAVYSEVPELLAELRKQGYKLGVISNFDRRLYSIFEHLRLREFFEHIVISSEVGADKPDPYIFQQALEGMRVAPAESIHVGDDPKRDWGAEAIGLHVFRLERPAHTLRDLTLALTHRATA